MELQHLEELEKRLALSYGMAPPEGIDSEAVLKEAKRRTEPWRHFPKAVLYLLRKANLLSSSNDDVEALQRLLHHRSKLQPVLSSLVSVYP